jgi:hypothetical protein
MTDSTITRSDVDGTPCLREEFPETDYFLGVGLIAYGNAVSLMQGSNEVIVEVESLRDVVAALIRAAEFLESTE